MGLETASCLTNAGNSLCAGQLTSRPRRGSVLGVRPHSHTMKTKDDRPVLTSIFYVLGVVALVGAILCAFESVSLAIAVAVAGIIYFGIGQAVDYLARTAHSTERLCTILETSITERLRAIETSSLPPVSPTTLSSSKVRYYYSTDGEQQGPADASDLKLMRKDGLITDDTPVLREGESQWRKFRDYLALSR